MPTLNYCVGPQPGRPFKCLTCGSAEKDPRQGSPLRAEGAELCRKTGRKGLLIASYQRLEKRLSEGRNSCRGGSPCPCTLGAARVAAIQAALPPSRPTLTGAELPRQKKVLCLCAQVCFGRVQLCGPADYGLPGFYVRGVLQARILECFGQYWLPCPSRALYFLLP